MKFTYMRFSLMVILLCMGQSCSEPEPSSTGLEEAEQTEERPDNESWQSSFIISREGLKVAEVWAGYVAGFHTRDEIQLSDSLHVDFYNKQGVHNSVLTAERGVVYNNTRNLTAYGNVKVVSRDGSVLESQELNWDNERQKIISNVEVKYTTNTDTFWGDAFESDQDLTHYEIKNPRGYSERAVPLKK